jgi:hypothetical protein
MLVAHAFLLLVRVFCKLANVSFLHPFFLLIFRLTIPPVLLACLACVGECTLSQSLYASAADLVPTAVLIFRTWVIFGRRKMLGIGLIVSSAATFVVVLSIMVYSIIQIKCMSDLRFFSMSLIDFRRYSRPDAWQSTLHFNRRFRSYCCYRLYNTHSHRFW